MPPGHPGGYPNWQRLTEDSELARTPTILYGAVVTADGVGPTILTLYEGPNATANRRIPLSSPADTSRLIYIPGGLLFEGGLFADVGSNDGGSIVFFAALEDAPPRPPAPPDE